MDNFIPPLTPQQEEAKLYARLLAWGTTASLIMLVLSFVAYLTGLMPAHVAPQQLPNVWTLPVSDYLQRTATPTGWHWLTLVGKGDLSNLVGIALLAGCSLPPLLGLIPLYLRQRDYVYASICTLVACVLVLAASGVLTGGH